MKLYEPFYPFHPAFPLKKNKKSSKREEKIINEKKYTVQKMMMRKTTGDDNTWIIKIIQLPMIRISICASTLLTHIYASTTTQAGTRTHARTHICSCICTKHFYLAYSTVFSLKWVKTKWKSKIFSMRERDRQGER